MALVSNVVTVTSTTVPVLLATAAGKTTVYIRNGSADHILVGDSGVSASTGYQVMSSDTAEFDLSDGAEIYAVTLNGNTVGVAIVTSN